jgi:hypothetical protein
LIEKSSDILFEFGTNLHVSLVKKRPSTHG